MKYWLHVTLSDGRDFRHGKQLSKAETVRYTAFWLAKKKHTVVGLWIRPADEPAPRQTQEGSR